MKKDCIVKLIVLSFVGIWERWACLWWWRARLDCDLGLTAISPGRWSTAGEETAGRTATTCGGGPPDLDRCDQDTPGFVWSVGCHLSIHISYTSDYDSDWFSTV